MNKLKALLIAGLLSLSSVSFASSITYFYEAGFTGTAGAWGEISLVEGDGGVTVGNIFTDADGDFYDLTTDSGALSTIALELDVTPPDTGNVTIALYDSLANLALGVGSALESGTNKLVATLKAGEAYFLQFTGEIGTSYNADVAAIPVPAAGILFATALFGAGVAGRRKKKSKTNAVVGAFARAS